MQIIHRVNVLIINVWVLSCYWRKLSTLSNCWFVGIDAQLSDCIISLALAKWFRFTVFYSSWWFGCHSRLLFKIQSSHTWLVSIYYLVIFSNNYRSLNIPVSNFIQYLVCSQHITLIRLIRYTTLRVANILILI